MASVQFHTANPVPPNGHIYEEDEQNMRSLHADQFLLARVQAQRFRTKRANEVFLASYFGKDGYRKYAEDTKRQIPLATTLTFPKYKSYTSDKLWGSSKLPNLPTPTEAGSKDYAKYDPEAAKELELVDQNLNAAKWTGLIAFLGLTVAAGAATGINPVGMLFTGVFGATTLSSLAWDLTSWQNGSWDLNTLKVKRKFDDFWAIRYDQLKEEEAQKEYEAKGQRP